LSVNSESLTRKSRIDPKLDTRGWRRVTAPSPAAAIVGAKKTAVDPQNVLTQAERYARGLASPYDFDGIRVPFLYSTNGELIWFRGTRNPDSRVRRAADAHTGAADRVFFLDRKPLAIIEAKKTRMDPQNMRNGADR
jgi:type I restriction enzyme R subunit